MVFIDGLEWIIAATKAQGHKGCFVSQPYTNCQHIINSAFIILRLKEAGLPAGLHEACLSQLYLLSRRLTFLYDHNAAHHPPVAGESADKRILSWLFGSSKFK